MTTAAERTHPLTMPIKMIWLAIVMLIASKAGVEAFTARYQIFIDTQEEKCIPEYSVYLIKKQFQSIERGKIYAFHANGLEPFFSDGVLLGKYASGVEGDTIDVTEHGIFVNHVMVAEGLILSEKLNVQPEQYYRTITLDVGSNEIFFTGTSPRSFDSRYWGLAQTKQVVGEAVPLW